MAIETEVKFNKRTKVFDYSVKEGTNIFSTGSRFTDKEARQAASEDARMANLFRNELVQEIRDY